MLLSPSLFFFFSHPLTFCLLSLSHTHTHALSVSLLLSDSRHGAVSRLQLGTLIRSGGPLYTQALLLAVSQILLETLHTTSINYQENICKLQVNNTENAENMENIRLKLADENLTNYSDIIEFLLLNYEISKVDNAREVRNNIKICGLDCDEKKVYMKYKLNLFNNFNSLFNVQEDNDNNNSNNSNSNNSDRNNDDNNKNNNENYTDSTYYQNNSTDISEYTDDGHQTLSIEEIFKASDNLIEAISFFNIQSIHDMQLYFNGEEIRKILNNIPKGIVFGEVQYVLI